MNKYFLIIVFGTVFFSLFTVVDLIFNSPTTYQEHLVFVGVWMFVKMMQALTNTFPFNKD